MKRSFVYLVCAGALALLSVSQAVAGDLPSELGPWLKTRGFVGALAADDVSPPDATEVDVTIQSNARTGEELAQVRSWNESAQDRTVHIEVATLPTHQRTVAYWVFPTKEAGCDAFGWTMCAADGRVLKSIYWQNDPALRVTGGASFPRDLYPDTIPPQAFIRVLGPLHTGAHGKLNQQLSPYGLIGQDVSVDGVENVTVPAGTFSVFRVSTVPNVESLMPSWPGFVLRVVERFVPRSTYYFDTQPPYRIVKQEGTLAAGGPEVTTTLVSVRMAGSDAKNATSPNPIAR